MGFLLGRRRFSRQSPAQILERFLRERRNGLAPGFYDDLMRIETEVVNVGKTSVTFGHQVFRSADDTLLVEGQATIVCVGKNLRPRRIPAEIRELFG